MNGNAKVLEHLQTALSMELGAMQQYMLHAHVVEDWGFDGLASKMREEMQEELGHAQEYTRRIMFLGGEPVVTATKPPARAQTVKDMLEGDLKDELDAIKYYTEAAQTADKASDIGSRDLFERIVLDEEGHRGWLQKQLKLLARLGEPAYLQMQIGTASAGAMSAE
ncbi:MAG: bacterioferritin [Hyphomicrobium sp.]